MKKLILNISMLILSDILFSQQEKYSRVKIFTDNSGLKKLAGAGVPIDHGNYKKGFFFESDFSASEINKIQSLGLNYETLIEDVSQFYQEANLAENKNSDTKTMATGCGTSAPKTYIIPSNFSLGTMGGYLKYSEFLANIDSMSAKFPNLITAKLPIDTFHSIEGKNIFWLKISDNPLVDENEPEIMYSALHHAREPASLSQLIFYMWYLLENYGTDPEVTYLVDNTEMFFVPMVNPDGYIYNQTTNPNGGGMWRKNRRPHGGNKFGVDLNRNYGLKWGFDDTGSSPDSTTDTYRGHYGFSEPETQALKFFCEIHNFKFVLNYHTYGDLFIYPWSYQENIYTPDSAYFVNYAIQATRDNLFNMGTANQTVGYTANGDSDDWMYGEQATKNKIFAATPEAGPADLGFWPASSNIISLCRSNMTQNLNMARFALKYARVKDESPILAQNLSGYFSFKILNLGLDTPSTFNVFITPLSNEITNIGLPKTFSSMNTMEEMTDSISYTLDSSIAPGTEFKFIVSVDNGLYVSTDTISKIYGVPVMAFNEAGNNINNWNQGSWGISNSIFHSPSSSITDSPSGNYSNNDVSSTELIQPVNLSNSIDAFLTFWARWEIEPGYDYAQVMASADGGNTWTPLCGKFTKPGNSNQDQGNPLYDGMQQNWVLEEISLKDFTGKNILIKFQITSDGFLNFDGFYFDDLRIEKIQSPPEMGIDSLIILPTNPSENDSVKIVAFSTLPSAGCSQSDILTLVLNDTIKINSTHSLGFLSVICNSVDTAEIGKLQSGSYSLIYSLSDSATGTFFDTDTLVFTVQPNAGIKQGNANYYFLISSNPACGTLNFNYSVPGNGTMIIYSYLGEMIFKKEISSFNNQLSFVVPNLDSGIYFYNFISDSFRTDVQRMALIK